MPFSKIQNSDNPFLKGLPISFAIGGILFLLFVLLFWENKLLPIVPGVFSDTIAVPIKIIQLGGEVVELQLDNFLLFQNFESLPTIINPWAAPLYGVIIWFLFSFGLALISTLKKLYFIAAAACIIILLTLSGANGLNIGGISSNYALIILMLGILIPVIWLSFYGGSWGIFNRFGLILIALAGTVFLLAKLSVISDPYLWMGENSAIPAAAVSVAFLLNIGHAFISGSSILLINLNKGTGLKITWHIILLSLFYFLLIFFSFLKLTGEVNLPFPTVPPVYLMLACGLMGYYVLGFKIEQTDQIFDQPFIGKFIYWLGFAITTFTWGWAIFKGNEPLVAFLNHAFIYGQVALSLLFFLYLMANFSQILNSGKDIDKIIFKPQFFAYFHMRIGSIMAFVILVAYADGIIGVQLASSNSNINADYYFQTDQPLEAAILYESAWIQYRKNDKAKNMASHLRFSLNQSNLAMENLYQVFDNSPSVINTLLLSSKLHQQEKIFDAVFYLEKGLGYFPDNPYLTNNLALLYSKLNRPDEAMNMVQKISENNPVLLSNLLGMQVIHRREILEDETIPEDLIYKINYLAYQNRKGNFTPFILDTSVGQPNFTIQTALLRNQWTNQINTPLEADLAMLDSLVGQEQRSADELNYRESRILRTLQESYINETLKYLNGTAMIHTSSAGYYHAISAKILIGELDYEKSAVDILVAEERGFRNFQPFHVAVLYFGGMPQAAEYIHQRYQIPYPDWMLKDENGNFVENEKTAYFRSLATLHRAMPSDFLNNLEEIADARLQAEFAFKILIHKFHWLEKAEYDSIKKVLLQQLGDVWNEEDLESWYAFIHSKGSIQPTAKIIEILQPELDLNRNAYWVPLVLKKVNAESDGLKKYEILQDAIQFSKDPMLWIQYVKESRKLGLDTYASDALSEMRGWLTIEQVERLQMENL